MGARSRSATRPLPRSRRRASPTVTADSTATQSATATSHPGLGSLSGPSWSLQPNGVRASTQPSDGEESATTRRRRAAPSTAAPNPFAWRRVTASWLVSAPTAKKVAAPVHRLVAR